MPRQARLSIAGTIWTLAILVVAFIWCAGAFANGLGEGFGKGLVAWLWDCLLPWVMIALVIRLPLLGIGGLMGLSYRPRESPENSGTQVEATDGSHVQ